MPMTKTEDVEAKYDVALNYPNLELHSAAASGNVGLVHYALTHGQPVNSVLHGVLPLHAACSGGSVSVVRMLIERGADVNAPRLPRRYSDGKKTSAPSVGAAGSTPLHFAAANGHAPIVQILLTCGATPDKADKNGMTPEALAEINGHTDVIRVLRLWERLKIQDSESGGDLFISDDQPSPSGSAHHLAEDETRVGSFKGKERAMSFASNVSEGAGYQAIKVKKSLEGFLRNRTGRSGSVTSSTGPDIPSVPSIPRISTQSEDGSPLPDLDNFPSPVDLSSPVSPSPLSRSGTPLGRVSSVASAGSSVALGLARVPSGASSTSGHSPSGSPGRTPSTTAPPPPIRVHPVSTQTSRRPSLPSILEKAAHPGATFRAALRREHGDRPPPVRVSPESSPNSADTSPVQSHHHGFFRGRLKSNENRRNHAQKYMSKQALVQLFRRNDSPPSRSPSPPKRAEASKQIAPEELDKGIERLRRASMDLSFRERASTSPEAVDEMEFAKFPPASAPATKTKFFPDDDNDPAMIPLPPSSPILSTRSSEAFLSPASIFSSDRRTRPRQGSEVIAPSPLANEWAHSSDSDSPTTTGIRRSKTEVVRPSSAIMPPKSRSNSGAQTSRSNPPSPLIPPTVQKVRSATLPIPPHAPGPVQPRAASGSKLVGLGWTEAMDMRKFASDVLQRNSTHSLVDQTDQTEHVDTLDGEDDDLFHDAEDLEGAISVVDEPEEFARTDSETPKAEDMMGGAKSESVSEEMVEDSGAKTSEETERGEVTTDDEETTQSEPVITSRPVQSQIIEMIEPRPTRQYGRYRGASIGSVSATTESSRISTPPGSSLRMSLINSDEEQRSPKYAQKVVLDSKMMPPPPAPMRAVADGRARGKSVSSMSSSTSGMGTYFHSTSPSGSSLTPASTLSLHTGGFPPVPENEVAHHPVTRRKVSSRAEVQDLVKQAEDDILQLANLPPSLDSSRSLAAQLATYGENHAIEAEYAERERRLRGSESGKSSDGDSWFSAQSDTVSALSGVDSSRGPEAPRGELRSKKGGHGPSSLGANSLLAVDAPRSSVPSINTIYDKRAAAYRERMAALTAVPPSLLPTSYGNPGSNLSSSARSDQLLRRSRAATSAESWLTAGASHHRPVGDAFTEPGHNRPSILASQRYLPVNSPDRVNGRSKKGPLSPLRQGTGSKAPSVASPVFSSTSLSHLYPEPRRGSSSSHRPPAPAPIAEVVSTRYAGMSPPPHVPQPPALSASSPYISIFSNRYAGNPHDGDDSDDDDQTQQSYTVVENTWRGDKAMDDAGFGKRGKWGQFKGAIGHLGRR